MSPEELGRLERVDLREAWQSEPGDFTPWLARAENLKLIGKILETELELEAEEKSVGPFRADILCKDLSDDSWVLIENQLERTDHTHLGQLLTYAAGLEAVTIVWVAQRFTEEHRAALDWLNDKTPEGIGFFGLEVELWRIGDSPPAPKFNVASKPNEWTRTVKRNTGGNPELAELCHDYWSGVLEALGPSGILHDGAKAARKQDIRFPVGWHNFWLKAYFSRNENRIGVWVSCRGDQFAENFETLRADRERIEAAVGGELVWSEHDGNASCFFGMDGCDPTNRDDWARQHALITEKLLALFTAVKDMIENIEEGDGHP